ARPGGGVDVNQVILLPMVAQIAQGRAKLIAASRLKQLAPGGKHRSKEQQSHEGSSQEREDCGCTCPDLLRSCGDQQQDRWYQEEHQAIAEGILVQAGSKQDEGQRR